MDSEQEYIPISGLQHLAFCPRQFALIHIEREWSENRLTAEGNIMHTKVHETDGEWDGGIRIARGLRLVSKRLGLSGIADVVEFIPASKENHSENTCKLPKTDGLWIAHPVEYKRGKAKSHNADEVQLCAQAICLEEMLDTGIETGALFYGKSRKRKEVVFHAQLRETVIQLSHQAHELFHSTVLPPRNTGKHCRNCSLADICHPDAIARKSVSIYMNRMLSRKDPS